MESNNNIIEQFDKELIELELKSKYSNTVIYKIVCKDVNINLVYVGHTINFNRRRLDHKTKCNNAKSKSYNSKKYSEIRNNGGWSNFNMIEIEKYPCSNKYEACKREQHYYEKLNANLNDCVPGSRFISQKQYNEQNKERIKLYQKAYKEQNKERIKLYRKLYRENHKINV